MNFLKMFSGRTIKCSYETTSPEELALIVTACEETGTNYDLEKVSNSIIVRYSVKEGVQKVIESLLPKYTKNLEEAKLYF